MGPFSISKWQMLLESKELFLKGFIGTVMYSVLGLIIAFIVGLILALFAVSRLKLLNIVNRIIIRCSQNIPLLIFIFFMYNGLPLVGIIMPVFLIGIIGIGVYQGAYISETFRAGIEAVPKAQYETAESQGMNYYQVMKLVILPQMFWSILPSLTNNIVNFIISTSMLAMIEGGEIMYTADSWSAYNMAYGPAYVVTAIIYFSLCFPLTRLSKRLESLKGGRNSG